MTVKLPRTSGMPPLDAHSRRITKEKCRDNDNKLAAAVTKMTGDAAIGTSSRVIGSRGKGLGHNAVMAEITLHQSSGYYSSAERFLLKFQQEMDRKLKSGAVRIATERRGELANLKDPLAQARSIAAIFVKKYRFVSHPISVYYAAIRKRELTPDECSEIISCVSRLGLDQKDQAMLAWLAVLERGGEDVRTRSSEEREDNTGEVTPEDGPEDEPEGIDGHL